MATGDLKNNLKQLMQELKSIKYGSSLDIDLVKSGSPEGYLPVYHYLFTGYSQKLNTDLVAYQLYGKSDMRFMEVVFKILRDLFQYKAKLTREQFFSAGFIEHKVIMATEIVRLVRKTYSPFKSSNHNSASSSHAVSRAVADSGKVFAAEAITLPRKSPAASAGFKVPKSGQPGPKHFQEKPVFGASSSSITVLGGQERAKRNYTADIKTRVVRACETPDAESLSFGRDILVKDSAATTPGHTSRGGASTPGHASRGGTSTSHTPRGGASATSHASIDRQPPQLDIEGLESTVTRKVIDLVSPALVKINERVGVMEINLSDLEQHKNQPERVVPQPSVELMNQLTKQMSDVMFQLQTLTSRLTLVENRMTMIEAQVRDEESHRKTLLASQAFTAPKSHKSAFGRQHLAPNVSAFEHNSSHTVAGNAVKCKPRATQASECFTSDKTHSRSTGAGEETAYDGKMLGGEHGDREAPAMQAKPSLGFMHTLCNMEGSTSPMNITDVEAEDLSYHSKQLYSNNRKSSEEEHLESTLDTYHNVHNVIAYSSEGSNEKTSMPVGASLQAPLSKVTERPRKDIHSKPPAMSPIRCFSDQLLSSQLHHDESVASNIPVDGYEADSSMLDRRSSTPSLHQQFDLDTSTIDRVSRINEMMATTQRLLL